MKEHNPLFKTHRLNAQGVEKAKAIAQAFTELIEALDLPPGRESAIVYTKLEEACFFAKKAIANKTENQEEQQW